MFEDLSYSTFMNTRMYVKCQEPGQHHCMFITAYPDEERILTCNAIGTQYMCPECKIVEGIEQLFHIRMRILREEETRAEEE